MGIATFHSDRAGIGTLWESRLKIFSSMCFTTNHKLLSQNLLFDYFIPVDPPELPIYIYCCIFPSQVRQWWS